MVTKIQNTNVERVSPAIATPAAVTPRRASLPSDSALADRVSGGGSASLPIVSEAVPATGENPFTALLAATRDVAATELRLAAGDATSESCEPAVAVLAMLAEIEGHAAPRGAWGPSKVREGYMQVTYDAQEERAMASGLERDGSYELAHRLVERPPTDARQVIQAPEWKGAVGGYFKGGDVNAFVQQVLRECYLLGMTDLQLYGDRLKALNELKKKIREEADRARKLKSQWATAAKGDENWVAPCIYAPVKVDGAQMALIPDTYTQADLDALNSSDEGKLIAKDDPSPTQDGEGLEHEGASAAEPSNTSFWVGTSMAPGDAGFLQSLSELRRDKIRNEPVFDDLKALVPKMSKNDISNWLLPILGNFQRHSHEGGILELLEVMSPEQRMFVAANGYGADSPAFWVTSSTGARSDAFTVEERAQYNRLMTEAAAAVADNGAVVVVKGGVTTERAKALWGEYAKRHNPSAKQAASPAASPAAKPAANPELSRQRLGVADRAIRDDLSRRPDFAVQKGAQAGVPAAPAAPAAPAGPAVGQAKGLDTVAAMDDYLKYLEEQMNSVGDDAQLANIDLQNCLQKQQQTLQMMSNISKVLHDVTMAIIRNLNS